MTAHLSDGRARARRSTVDLVATMVAVIVFVAACTGASDSPDASPPPTASSVPVATTERPVAPSTSTAITTAATTTTTTTTTVAPQASDAPDATTNADSEGAQELGPLGETELQIDTDDGTFELGLGNLPDALDPTFPIPDDFAVDLLNEDGSAFGFTGTTQLGVDEAIEFYLDGLPAAGYEITDSDIAPGSFAVVSFVDDAGTGQVAISEAPGSDTGTTVIVTFGG